MKWIVSDLQYWPYSEIFTNLVHLEVEDFFTIIERYFGKVQ